MGSLQAARVLAGCSESESIVQRIFGGVLQSEVICSACCHISTAHDPFLDISLDIGAPPLPPPPMLKPPSHSQHRCCSSCSDFPGLTYHPILHLLYHASTG